MNAFSIPGAPAWFNLLLNLSFQAAFLAALVWIVLKIAGRWIPPAWRALMWSLVILRVLIPIAPPSQLSLQNLFVASNPPAPTPRINVQPVLTPNVQLTDVVSNVFYNPVIHTLPLESAAAPREPRPIGKPLSLGWTLGGIFFFGILIARSLVIRHRVVRHGFPASETIAETIAVCRERLRLRWPIRITVSDQIAAPALTGLFPARLIIPTNFAPPNFTLAQIHQILLHELAHVQQGHLFLHWLALIARALHWFNPAIHFAASQLRQECELAADAAVLKDCSLEERTAYGETILQVVSHAAAPPTLLALGMAEQARHLEQRLRAVALPPRRSFQLLGVLSLALLSVIGLTSAGDRVEEASPNEGVQINALARQVDRQIVRNKNAISSEIRSEVLRTDFVQITQVEYAHELIRSGRIAEAERVLQDTVNSGLNSVSREEIRIATRPVTNIAPQPPSLLPQPSSKPNLVPMSDSRRGLYRKLETIRIDEFPLEKETDLVEVLKTLGSKVCKEDPTGRGVNFVISQAVDKSSKGPVLDVERFKIKFDPPIRDVTLGQFLDAIVAVAQPPTGPPPTIGLMYSVEDYSIVFSERTYQREQLVSRTFRVVPDTFRQGLESVYFTANPFEGPFASAPSITGLNHQRGNDQGTGITYVTTSTNAGNTQKDVRAFFTAAGADFPTNNVAVGGAVPSAFGTGAPGQPGQKALFYNDRTGVLFVRATEKDLNIVENALHAPNLTPARKVKLDVQVFDASPSALPELLQPVFPNPPLAPPSFANTTNFILAPSPASTVLKAVENAAGASVTNTSATGVPGRQIRVINDGDWPEVGGSNLSLDVITTLAQNGELELASVLTVNERLPSEPNGVPRFRVRQVAVPNTRIPSNASQLICAPMPLSQRSPIWDDHPAVGRLFRSGGATNQHRVWMILITPTLVD